MIPCLTPIILGLSLAVHADDLPVLRVGEKVEDVIRDTDPLQETDFLRARDAAEGVAARRYRIVVDETGPYHAILRSEDFDAHLVLRSAEGDVLFEDSNTLVQFDSRLNMKELRAGADYVLEACALRGHRGTFTLELGKGWLVHYPPAERAVARVVDARKRLALAEREGDPTSPYLAYALNRLAGAHWNNRQYEESRGVYERLLAIREEHLGPEHPDTVDVLDFIGRTLFIQSRFSEAREYYERAKEIRERTLGPDHLSMAHSLRNLGDLLIAERRPDEALELHRRALTILEEHDPKSGLVAETKNNLAVHYWRRARYEEAQILYEQALALREEIHGPHHPEIATVLNNLAILRQDLGFYAEAREYLERALEIRSRLTNEVSREIPIHLDNLGSVLVTLGLYDEARPVLDRAHGLRLRYWGTDHPHTANSLVNLGSLLQKQGLREEARPMLDRALEIYAAAEESGYESNMANALSVLGNLLESQGSHDEARDVCERALAIREEVLGPMHRVTASSLDNLGDLHLDRGRFEEAREHYERGRKIRETTLGPGHPDVAHSIYRLGGVLREQGRVEEAVPLFEQALAICEETLGPAHPRVAETTETLALTRADLGEVREAWELLRRDDSNQRGRLRRLLASQSEQENYRFLASSFSRLETLLSLARRLDEPEVRREAYEAVSSWKGQVARLLATSHERFRQELDPKDRRLARQMRELQGQLSAVLYHTGLDPQTKDERLRELREKRNQLELQWRRSIEVEPAHEVEYAQLLEDLPPRSTLVSFLVNRDYRPARYENGERLEPSRWSEPRLSAWIAHPNHASPRSVELGPVAEVEERVEAFLQGLAAPRGVPVDESTGAPDPAAELRALLWDPLAPHVKDAEIVFLSPDGAVGTFPFETIRLPGGDFLVEHHGFVYVQDASAIADAAEPRRGAPGPLLCVGGVDFQRRAELDPGPVIAAASPSDDRPSREISHRGETYRGSFGFWPSLPHTDQEARVLLDMHEAVTGTESRRLLLRGTQATEERLCREMPAYSTLHFATHGFFLPKDMTSVWDQVVGGESRDRPGAYDAERRLVGNHPGLLSALVCAGANTPAPDDRHDSYLTAEEVSWLDLSGVELVVLSACQSGMGQAQAGEGLIGIRRAFCTAGARTVISSFWKVSDESTSELMRAFYDNLWIEGMGTLEALRAAQIEMLRRNRALHDEARPLSWGAFVLNGDWR